MRRKSRKTDHRSPHSDILDDLDDYRPASQKPTPPVRVTAPLRKLSEVNDQRRWAPGGREPPREFSGRPARISHKPKNSPLAVRRGPGGKALQSRKTVWSRVETGMPRFAAAAKTVICFKRKERREVLHALKLKRSGRGSPKRKTPWSEVHC